MLGSSIALPIRQIYALTRQQASKILPPRWFRHRLKSSVDGQRSSKIQQSVQTLRKHKNQRQLDTSPESILSIFDTVDLGDSHSALLSTAVEEVPNQDLNHNVVPCDNFKPKKVPYHIRRQKRPYVVTRPEVERIVQRVHLQRSQLEKATENNLNTVVNSTSVEQNQDQQESSNSDRRTASHNDVLSDEEILNSVKSRRLWRKINTSPEILKRAEAGVKEMVKKNGKFLGATAAITSIVAGWAQLGDMNKAWELVKDCNTQLSVKPSIECCRALLRGWIKNGDVEQAHDLVFNKMPTFDLQPDGRILNILASGFAMEGNVDKAKEIVETMCNDTTRPQSETHKDFMVMPSTVQMVVSALADLGQLDEAIEFLQQFYRVPNSRSHVLLPTKNTAAFDRVIRSLSHGNKQFQRDPNPNRALTIFKDLLKAEMVPTDRTWMAFDTSTEQKMAMMLFNDQMQNIRRTCDWTFLEKRIIRLTIPSKKSRSSLRNR